MFMDVYSVKPWMMKGVRVVIQSTILNERKEDYRNGWGNDGIFFVSKEEKELTKSTQWINNI